MQAIGFDNDKYLRMQSEKIRERIGQFGGKLYLEFGGKLFDDYHASRVLPGFAPDSKVRMLMEMRDEAEIIIAISADDIERNKRRGDLGITYDDDTLRLIDAFQGCGLYVGSVVITHHRGQPAAEKFQRRLETLGIRVYRHYIIPDYPSDVARIVSDDGECRAVSTFSQVEQLLRAQENFIVCNRGVILNMDKVLRLDSDCFEMLDGTHLPVRLKDKNTLFAQFTQYQFRHMRREL